ncbi:FAD-binding oxidoreductase [Candidatus Binatia bacterium]|jgi:FAD/FMN-containing dehydrogenase|nr:FAD-binding oxidoreductase [Candidatus Binatia bacterium]
MTTGDRTRTVSPALRGALTRAVGRAHLLLDPDLTAAYETDWTGRFAGRASGVVRPGTTDEVADVLRACSAALVPVVPQGGNTGLVGGSVPRDGDLVLSTTRLRGTCVVDRAAAEIVAPAGATLLEVQRAARDAGFDFGVDIAPRDSCTVGGMIATNAGGVHVLRHGMMVDQVIGVEAVLADGGIVGRVPALRKDNAGYHLTSLLAGSEGTLAIITRAHLRLTPAFPARAVALLGLPDLDAVVTAVECLRPSLPSLSALELVSAACVELVCRHTGLLAPLDGAPPILLLVECAGRADVIGELASAVAACGELVRSSAVADDAAGMRRLWRYREDVSAAINAAGVPHKLDVAVPLRAIPRFVAAVTERIAELAPGAQLALFGHVGDGNLHVNLLGLAADDERVDEAVLALVVAEGGSIASEHGLGRAKARYLALVRNERERTALGALKRALDPAGILNPGVVLA